MPFHKNWRTKMKFREKPRVRPRRLTSLAIIINVQLPLYAEELEEVANNILADPDKNSLDTVNHYIFIGNKLLITPIINKITDFYDIQWCGEYCVASYKPHNQYVRYAPVARLKMGPMQSLEIHLKNLKILYIPKITKLRYVFDFLNLINYNVSDLDMVCSCNTKYEGGDYQEWLHFEHHDENEAGLHYFVSERNIERLNDEVIRYFQNRSFTKCIIYIVDTKLEHLENCWYLSSSLLINKMRKRPRFKAIV